MYYIIGYEMLTVNKSKYEAAVKGIIIVKITK